MRLSTARIAASCLLILGIGLSGCGGDKGPPVATISGAVTLDGAPLDEGAISFVPTDGNSASGGAKIVDGAYTATVPLGPKRVEIRAPKVVGTRKAYDTPDSPVLDIIKELVPAKYNIQSELTTTVSEDKTDVDFKLTGEANK